MEELRIRYVPAVREDAALGVASAAHFAGMRGAILLQNSGLGNIINPLTSFSLLYKIPVLLIIGWRGYQDNDAPEHLVMGRKTTAFLDTLEIPYEISEEHTINESLDTLVELMDEHRTPVALLLLPGFVN